MNFCPVRDSHHRLAVIVFAALFLVGGANSLLADTASPWVESPQSSARLISAVEAVGDLQQLPLGVEITLKPGWKTYWRSPGDAGIPATIDLVGSRNAGLGQLRWPVPHRFQLFGLQTFGYSDHVVLPLDVAVPNPGEPVSIRLLLRYLVCEEICIPLEAPLALDLPSGKASPSDEAGIINRYASLVPASAERLGWHLSPLAFNQEGDLVIDVRSDWEALNSPDAIVEGSLDFSFLPPVVALSADHKSARLTFKSEHAASQSTTDQKNLTVTLFDGSRSMELVTRPIFQPGTANSLSGVAAILSTLGIALLGGLILNIMPCVLPVLVLKLTSVLEMSNFESRRLRMSFLATSAGILLSFLALASVLFLVKLSGASIGWGIQFQQPLFLALMVLVCLAFAANLFGLYEIPMPAFIGSVSIGGDRRLTGRYAKAFFSGVLATALATPCSAPFVGTAITFALAGGPGDIFMIFATLGLGLSLPYLAVAIWPRSVRLLPRPGPWMPWLKRILAVSLIGTSIWLLSVMGGQLGWAGFWANEDRGGPWVPFEAAKIDQLVADNHLVFVDVTADWCLTCQANKKLVLDRDPVAEVIRNKAMVAMRADWTNPDPQITDFLTRFGRYGIPFNVVFGPKSPAGIVLPELLTTDDVLQAIADAGGLSKAMAESP